MSPLTISGENNSISIILNTHKYFLIISFEKTKCNFTNTYHEFSKVRFYLKTLVQIFIIIERFNKYRVSFKGFIDIDRWFKIICCRRSIENITIYLRTEISIRQDSL